MGFTNPTLFSKLQDEKYWLDALFSDLMGNTYWATYCTYMVTN